MSFFNHRDAPIVVGINERGVFIIDKVNGVSVVLSSDGREKRRKRRLSCSAICHCQNVGHIQYQRVFVYFPVSVCVTLQTLLLGLRYDELSWDLAKPSATDDPDCLPCIFIQVGFVRTKVHIFEHDMVIVAMAVVSVPLEPHKLSLQSKTESSMR